MLRCDATPWRQEHGPRVGLGSQRPGSLDRFSSWKMVGKNGRCSTVFFQKNGGFHGFVTEKSWEIWQISVSNRSVKSPEFMDLWSSKNWWSNGYLNIYIYLESIWAGMIPKLGRSWWISLMFWHVQHWNCYVSMLWQVSNSTACVWVKSLAEATFEYPKFGLTPRLGACDTCVR